MREVQRLPPSGRESRAKLPRTFRGVKLLLASWSSGCKTFSGFMPKRTPRRRRHSVGGSPARSPEPEAEPEAEFGTPLAAADVGAELAEVPAPDLL